VAAAPVDEFATSAHHVAARSWLDKLSPHPVTDAVSFAMMESLGWTQVLTFDSDFEIAGFTRRR
jgi:predicted nucleic acid-binding protein